MMVISEQTLWVVKANVSAKIQLHVLCIEKHFCVKLQGQTTPFFSKKLPEVTEFVSHVF